MAPRLYSPFGLLSSVACRGRRWRLYPSALLSTGPIPLLIEPPCFTGAPLFADDCRRCAMSRPNQHVPRTQILDKQDRSLLEIGPALLPSLLSSHAQLQRDPLHLGRMIWLAGSAARLRACRERRSAARPLQAPRSW